MWMKKFLFAAAVAIAAAGCDDDGPTVVRIPGPLRPDTTSNPVQPPPGGSTGSTSRDTLAVGTREDTIQWAGYRWRVVNAHSQPGPTHFSSRNAWVDENGFLHLRLSRINGVWYGAYVQMIGARPGFGRYEWEVEGNLGALDHHVVLGLFNYAGPSGRNEIDIEFAKWGIANNPSLWYTVWPAAATSQTYHAARPSLPSGVSTHRFEWRSNRVVFESRRGGAIVAQWVFAPSDPGARIPQQGMPVAMNLWTYQGVAPSNGRNVEIVIRSFRYTP